MTTQAKKQSTDALWERVKGIEIAMLTTVDRRDGSLHSRPMLTACSEFKDNELWFFSKEESMKMDDVESMNQVNLCYCRPCSSTFISLSGTAKVVHDKEKARSLWSPMMSAYFKGGVEDPQLALLRVKVARAEMWDVTAGTMDFLSHAMAASTMEEATSHGIYQKFNLKEQPS